MGELRVNIDWERLFLETSGEDRDADKKHCVPVVVAAGMAVGASVIKSRGRGGYPVRRSRTIMRISGG